DAEVEQRPFRVRGDSGALGAFDLLELVNFGSFAIVCAADTVGKKLLEPRIAAHDSLAHTAACGLALAARPRVVSDTFARALSRRRQYLFYVGLEKNDQIGRP